MWDTPRPKKEADLNVPGITLYQACDQLTRGKEEWLKFTSTGKNTYRLLRKQSALRSLQIWKTCVILFWWKQKPDSELTPDQRPLGPRNTLVNSPRLGRGLGVPCRPAIVRGLPEG